MRSSLGWQDAAWAHGTWPDAALWQAWLTPDSSVGLEGCSEVAHGTEVGRAVSQDTLVLLQSQPFPSSFASFGLISPLNPPGTNLFPTFTISQHRQGLC